mmetsp:Transcript_11877/g.34820  ORF Transcript_11877/g.34820 Transcript_11877/m.34820 type:complete len:97 (+) Transcript_11877:748-1038(+)
MIQISMVVNVVVGVAGAFVVGEVATAEVMADAEEEAADTVVAGADEAVGAIIHITSSLSLFVQSMCLSFRRENRCTCRKSFIGSIGQISHVHYTIT